MLMLTLLFDDDDDDDDDVDDFSTRNEKFIRAIFRLAFAMRVTADGSLA